MSNIRDNVILFVTLTISSVTIYMMQYVIFHDASSTFFYFLQDMAFLPIQALIVSLVINRFMNVAEKRRKVKKNNVAISTFFVDAGVEIMMILSKFDKNHLKECEMLKLTELLENKGKNAKKIVESFEYSFNVEPKKLSELVAAMEENRGFLLTLLQNPNLHEHEAFTDMLWAVFHIADELKTRGDLNLISDEDASHLAIDLLRAYKAMVMEWIGYINYLNDEYPFLYKIAIRKNPFSSEVN
jgi:hypothetical protein